MKNKMIKRMATLVTAAIIAATFSACGSDSSPGSTTTVEPTAEVSSEPTVSAEAPVAESETETESSNDPYAGALAGVKLSIGTDVSFVPFAFPDENDVYTGFDMDLIAAMSEYLGFEYELQPMDFTAMLMSVQTEKLDVGIAGITMTDEREEVMDFSEPYYDAGIQILVREDSGITSFADLADKTLAIKEGTASLTYVEEHYPNAKIVTFSTIDEAYLEVQRGAADATIFDAPNMLYYVSQNPSCGCKVVGELEDACQYGILFPAGSENKEYFDAALEKFREDGTYDEIYNKWFGTN